MDDRQIKVTKMSGTRSGYYRPAGEMERPYVVSVDGKLLETATGRLRRFRTAGAARRAAERVSR